MNTLPTLLGLSSASFIGGSIANRATAGVIALTTAFGEKKLVENLRKDFVTRLGFNEDNTYHKVANIVIGAASLALTNTALLFAAMYGASYVLPITAFTPMGALGTAAFATALKVGMGLMPSNEIEKPQTNNIEKEIKTPEVFRLQNTSGGLQTVDKTGSFVFLTQEEGIEGDPKPGDILTSEVPKQEYGIIQGNLLISIADGGRQAFLDGWKNIQVEAVETLSEEERSNSYSLVQYQDEHGFAVYGFENQDKQTYLSQAPQDRNRDPRAGDLLIDWSTKQKYGVVCENRIIPLELRDIISFQARWPAYQVTNR